MKEMRELGKTGIIVNRLGLGGIPIQRITKEEGIEVIQYAVSKGINFIDSARGYTCSEEYIGEAIKDIRDKVYLATKSMARTYEQMKKDIEISLSNFQTDHIDLYQMHNVKNIDEFKLIISTDGAYKALSEAKAQGKICHIGITAHSQDFLKWLLNSEYVDMIETVQFPINFIEDNGIELLNLAKEKGKGTIAMKPLGGGAIDRGSVGVKWLMNVKALDVAIPGIGDKKEVDDFDSIKNYEISPEEDMYIKKLKKDLDGEFCHRCGYCMPCTKGIDIPGTFTLERYYKYYNLKDWAIKRYFGAKVLPSACIKCNACVKRCPYELDIPRKLEKIVKIFEKSENDCVGKKNLL